MTLIDRADRTHRALDWDTVPETDVALIADDVYELRRGHHTLGFVQRIGNVFVALEGTPLNRACEVGQSLSWDVAVLMVEAATGVGRGHAHV